MPRTSLATEVYADRQTLFFTAYLLCLAGLLGMTTTGDAFNLFVFLEISSLSSYTLISFGTDRRALTASFQYLIMGTIGATMLLIGIGFIYMMTGTLNMADLAERLPAVYETKTVRAAFAFIVIGLSIKLALFPLHTWLPNAYSLAPSALTVFLAGHVDQGCALRADPLCRDDLRRRLRLWRDAAAVHPALDGGAGGVLGLVFRHLSDQYQTVHGLFEPGADRLHG